MNNSGKCSLLILTIQLEISELRNYAWIERVPFFLYEFTPGHFHIEGDDGTHKKLRVKL